MIKLKSERSVGSKAPMNNRNKNRLAKLVQVRKKAERGGRGSLRILRSDSGIFRRAR